jgi:hypothetical protein
MVLRVERACTQARPVCEVNTALEKEIKTKQSEIASKMSALGRRLESGDDSELLVWVIPNALACAHRPLRHHRIYGGNGQPIPEDAKPLILDWVEQIRIEGIVSIVSFMHDRDLACYRAVDWGGRNLMDFLSSEEFRVCHLPWEDPHHKRTEAAKKRAKLEQVRRDALAAYDQLPKPALLLCSAGVDRSAPVAAFIWSNRKA